MSEKVEGVTVTCGMPLKVYKQEKKVTLAWNFKLKTKVRQCCKTDNTAAVILYILSTQDCSLHTYDASRKNTINLIVNLLTINLREFEKCLSCLPTPRLTQSVFKN